LIVVQVGRPKSFDTEASLLEHTMTLIQDPLLASWREQIHPAVKDTMRTDVMAQIAQTLDSVPVAVDGSGTNEESHPEIRVAESCFHQVGYSVELSPPQGKAPNDLNGAFESVPEAFGVE
jgi:hypothetical protein